jgi:hypothetical protein
VAHFADTARPCRTNGSRRSASSDPGQVVYMMDDELGESELDEVVVEVQMQT